MGEGYEAELLQFMGGLKRMMESSRADNGRSLDEGKKGKSYKVNKRICIILLKSDMMII